MGSGYGMGFGGGFMWIFWILLIALIIWLGRNVISRDSPPRERSARELLDQRYARGEIDRDTYEQMKQDLR